MSWNACLPAACISSLVNESSGSPTSCRYKQSPFVHVNPRKCMLQYLDVPKEQCRTRSSSGIPSQARMQSAADAFDTYVM
jgi:hypothetical protein